MPVFSIYMDTDKWIIAFVSVLKHNYEFTEWTEKKIYWSTQNSPDKKVGHTIQHLVTVSRINILLINYKTKRTDNSYSKTN